MKNLIFLCLLVHATQLHAQQNTLTALADTPHVAPPALPFAIAAEKKLPPEEIEDKKEGTFITGLPRFEFDPIRGFGVGGNVFLLVNKDKNDPFFEYTPYRHRLAAEFFIFQNGRIRYALNYDVPYIFNTKWRLRTDIIRWEDPNAQYWGIGRQSLQPLSFRDKRTGQQRTFRKVKDYEENLLLAERQPDGTYTNDFHYNHMMQDEQLYNFMFERVLAGGKVRLMFGYEALFNRFASYKGKTSEVARNLEGNEVVSISNATRLDEQIADGTWERFNLRGFPAREGNRFNFTSMLAAALMYDTRDFEPDPSKGVFLQYSHEYSAPWIGSQFNFNKFMVQAQLFKTLYKCGTGKRRITFAGLAAFGHVFGPNVSFIELWDLNSQSEAGGIMVLGGARSIRGFREARFLAPTVGLVNLELRSRLTDFKLLNQHFILGITPFYDMGTVWDSPRQVSLTQLRGAPGLGARLNWNQSTVLRFDFAASREGSQAFFGFGHIF